MTNPASATTPAFALAPDSWQRTIVRRLQRRGGNVLEVELVAADGTRLAPFTAGAHVNLRLPGPCMRSYSLMNLPTPGAAAYYQLGILRVPNGGGGSDWLHTSLREGDRLHVSLPLNMFPLAMDATQSVFIAGGIGITPLLCMARQQAMTGRPQHLYYCVRSRSEAAFLDEAKALGIAMTPWFDDERGGPPDLTALLREQPRHAHFYCCGPAPMLAAFEQARQRLELPHAQTERFAAAAAPAEAASNAEVTAQTCPEAEIVLARSQRVLQYAGASAGSLLQFLLAQGITVPYGCRQGVCGTCSTRLIEGEVVGLDPAVSNADAAPPGHFLPCVSRCQSRRLVLDL